MNFSKYENKFPWPKKPTKPVLGSLSPSTAEIKQYQNDIADFEIKDIDFKASIEKAQEEEARLHDLFKQDLFKNLGIVDHPKKDKIFSLAWQLGHSNGLSEVASYADDIVKNLFDDERFQIGDVVCRKDGDFLRSGCSAFNMAIVISLDPFAIVSEAGDMLWQNSVVPLDFRVKGKASKSVLDICMRRLGEVTPRNSNQEPQGT